MLRPFHKDMNGRHTDRRIIFMLNLCRSTYWLAYVILNSLDCLDTTAVTLKTPLQCLKLRTSVNAN